MILVFDVVVSLVFHTSVEAAASFLDM